MKIAEIDFPEPLLAALRSGRLVIFAGAGVSMGEPSCLPDFAGLACKIAAGTGQTLQNLEPVDRFLGRLQHAGVDVHARAVQALSRGDLKPTELHRDLLRLSSGAGRVRVVTTNFDRLFEQASKDVLDSSPEVFQAPALPLGNDFNGIVHVHGAIRYPEGMVLTDRDFGRAYLTEGWARRFLVALFRQFTVLFVGYGHNDTVMNYLARALPESAASLRFALTRESDSDLQRWRVLGIEPIQYPQDSDDDYSKLHEGIRRLADFSRRSVLDWKREITELARKKPPLLGDEEAGLIEEALKDETRTRFFTDAASSPEWIDWLDKRKHLDALFGSGTLGKQDEMLAQWLAERFAFSCADKLFLLIARHGTHLHPHFWWDLGRKIESDKQDRLEKKFLSCWVSLLLATAPVDADKHVFLGMGKRCVDHGMLDSLLGIFDAITGSRLQLKRSFPWPDSDKGNQSPSVEVDLPLIRDASWWSLNKLWEESLKPNLAQVGGPLLGIVIHRLEQKHLTLRAWRNASRKWDSDSFHRSAIEPHEQNERRRATDVLIDAARDCLEWSAKNQADTARHWCAQLVVSEAPLLRRLAVHALSARADLTADGKIDWLLEHIGLHDLPARHEIFRVVRFAYPEASPERRKAIIDAVRAYRWPDEQDPDKERRGANYQLEWLHWLHGAAPDCALTKQALDAVTAQQPEFRPREGSDFIIWSGGAAKIIQPLSPWTTENLLSKPGADWLRELVSFQSTEFIGPSRDGLVNAVREAAKQEFDWGLGLADELAKAGAWSADLWSGLIRAWSGMDLDEDKHRTVFNRLGRVELYAKHAREIADALEALVEDDGKPYALNLLPQANEIAASLWRHLDRTAQIEGAVGWLNEAINHPAGVLAEFWLCGVSLWRKHQKPLPKAMSDEYRTVLSDIVQDPTVPGRLGRSVLAGQFAFLLAADEGWTKENLTPLFGNRDNIADFQAVWDGFLTWGRFNPTVAENLHDAFLEAVQQIDSDLANRRNDFVTYYTTMLAYFAAGPLETWVRKLLDHGGEEARRRFAFEIGNHLSRMDETRQREWWCRWLKRYWGNRVQGVPAPLEPGEVETMLGWLPALTAVFPEAVALAIRMPQVPLQHGDVIYELSNSDSLVRKHPQEVAKLLIYLGQCDSPGYVWYKGTELVEKLIQSGLPKKLEQGLKELKVKKGL